MRCLQKPIISRNSLVSHTPAFKDFTAHILEKQINSLSLYFLCVYNPTVGIDVWLHFFQGVYYIYK